MSLNKRLIAGGAAGPAYYGGEIQYTVPSNGADTTLDIGFRPDFLWLFPVPEDAGQNQPGSPGYNYILDRDFLTEKQQINDGSSWTQGSNDLISWSDTGFTLKKSTATNGNQYSWYKDTNSHVGVAFATSDTGVTNTDGDITSTVYVNPESNVSKFTFTGNGTNKTVGHGLGTTPQFVLMMKLANYTTSAGNYNETSLATPFWYDAPNNGWKKSASSYGFSGAQNSIAFFDADSTTVTTDNSSGGGGDTQKYIAYAFASKPGFSKYNSFTGNGTTTTRSVAGTLDFDPVSTFFNKASGNDMGAVFLGTRESGSIGSLPKWIRGYDSAISDRDNSTFLLDPGEYIRYDHRTNKRVLYNSASIQPSGFICSVLTFGGDYFYQYEK